MAKKQKCPEFENHERWLVSYADMVTLLFAVFVVLYSLNLAKNPSKSEEVAGSIEESFNRPLEDIPERHRVGPTEAGFGIFEHFRGTSVRPPLMKKFPGLKDKPIIIENELNRVKLQLEERLYGPQKFPKGTSPGQERVVSVSRTEDGFKVQLLARHFYEPGATKVRREALPELDKVAGVLKELGRPLVIEGHTDSVPAKNMSNWQLSALRATEILQYFIVNHNFPPTLLGAAGYADTHPLASNSTEFGRQLNRRIEIRVKYDPDVSQDTNENR